MKAEARKLVDKAEAGVDKAADKIKVLNSNKHEGGGGSEIIVIVMCLSGKYMRDLCSKSLKICLILIFSIQAGKDDLKKAAKEADKKIDEGTAKAKSWFKGFKAHLK